MGKKIKNLSHNSYKAFNECTKIADKRLTTLDPQSPTYARIVSRMGKYLYHWAYMRGLVEKAHQKHTRMPVKGI
jgi:hypothetical protein